MTDDFGVAFFRRFSGNDLDVSFDFDYRFGAYYRTPCTANALYIIRYRREIAALI